MDHKYRNSALLATTALGLGFGAVAPAFAQSADANDIIVTARRVEERLQDVPVSITVFNQEALDDRSITNASDLATYTPSMSASSNFGTQNASFAIRGFVQDNFTAPSVGVYFADVISPRGAASVQSGDGAGPGSFFDLQNAQVLKGPQGTLFGRNTTGGAVLLVPQRPTREFGGYAQGSLGNYGMQGFQGVLNIPMGDEVRLRLGVDQMTRDGYLDNIGAYGPAHLANTDYIAARASLVVDIAPNLENYSILSYTRSETDSFTQRPTSCNPDAVIRGPGQVMPTGRYSCAQVARLDAADNFYAVENAVDNPGNELEQAQLINTTTWNASDHLTIRNIFSFAELRNYSRSSVFGNYWIIDQDAPTPDNTVRPGYLGQVVTPAQITNAPDHPLNNQNTLTEELQFQGDAFDNRFIWQAGLYYEQSRPIRGFAGTMGQNNGLCGQIGYDPVANAPDISSCALPYNLLSGTSRDVRQTRFTDRAVYAQGTYHLTEQLGLTVGLRYTDDESESISQNFGYAYLNDALINTRCTNPNTGPGGPALPDCITLASVESSATTGVVDLEYRATDDLLTYVKYSRGYRQGMVNPRGIPPYDEIEPESVNNYEIGVKSSWDGQAPGFLNVAVHYNDFSQQQLLVSFTDAQGRTNASACACGTSTIYGVEVDGGVRPFEGLELSASLAYLHTELEDFADIVAPADFPNINPSNVVGMPLTQSPEWKASVTAAYTLPLDESIGEVSVSGTYTYTDDYYTVITDRGLIPSFSIVNLNLNWNEIGGHPVDLALFANNVTDEEYYTFTTDLYDSALGFTSSVQGLPRMYGARLRFRFGAEAS